MALRRTLALFLCLLLLPALAYPQAPVDRAVNGALTAAWNGTLPQPANTAAQVSLAGQGAAAIQITGTFVGTVQFESLIDEKAATWLAISGTPFTGGATVTSATAPGAWLFSLGGTRTLRARCSAFTSGTINVGIISSTASAAGAAMTTVTGTVTANIGTTGGLALDATSSAISGKLPAALVGGRLSVDGSGVTQPVSAAALPLPAGAATEATLSAASGKLPAALVGGRLSVDGSGVTQPVSGTVTANQGTSPWVVAGGASGGAAVLNPINIAGQNAGNVKYLAASSLGSLLVASTEALIVGGSQADNAALAGNPQRLGLSDNTNIQTWKQTGAATGTTGTGVGAVGPLLWDSVGATNFVKQAGDGSGRAMVVGAAAAGAAVAGNPLLIGGSDGSNAQFFRTNTNIADAEANAINLLLCNSRTSLYSGVGWDRQRDNIDAVLFASAARTTTQTSADITTYNCHSLICTLDMTVVGTGSVTLTINYKDPASGKYILLLSGAAVTTNSTNVYTINPNIPAVANVNAQKDLGRIIQFVVTAGNANSATYSVGYTLIN